MTNVVPLHNVDTSTIFHADSSIFFPVWEFPLQFKGRTGSYDVPSHKAIVRDRDGVPAVLGVVGKNYQIITTKEVCQAAENEFRSAMTPEQLHGARVTDKTAYYGSLCIRDYQFPSINVDIDGKGSTARFRTIVTNGYDGSTSLKIYTGAIDGFCTNGMVTGAFDLIAKRHTKGVELPKLAERIRANIKIFYTEAEKWKKWAKKEITRDMAKDVFDAMPAASERLTNKLLRQFDIECLSRGKNVWALFSAATYYATYAEGEFSLRSTDNDHSASTMLGREMQVRRWTKTEAFTKIAA